MARPRLRQRRLLSRRTSPRQQSLEIKRDHGCVEALHGARSPKGGPTGWLLLLEGSNGEGTNFLLRTFGLTTTTLLPHCHIICGLGLEEKTFLTHHTPHGCLQIPFHRLGLG